MISEERKNKRKREGTEVVRDILEENKNVYGSEVSQAGPTPPRKQR